MLRTFKYLLRPTLLQDQALDFLLWQARLLYNAALEQRITVYQETGKGISYPQQWAHFRVARHDHPDTLGKLNAACVQHLLRRLDKAFSAFFRRLKTGAKAGYPRFKSRDRFRSIEYTYGDGCKLHTDEHGRVSLYVQNVGEVRLCYHRTVPREATLKHAVIQQVNRRWYVCLMLALPDPLPTPASSGKRAVGIDVGLSHLLALSNGSWLRIPAGCGLPWPGCACCSAERPAGKRAASGRKTLTGRWPGGKSGWPISGEISGTSSPTG